jgi:hypothetical protein
MLVLEMDLVEQVDDFCPLLASLSCPFGSLNPTHKPLFLGVREPLKHGFVLLDAAVKTLASLSAL